LARVSRLLRLLVPLALSTAPALASEAERARELFREGNEAFAAGDLHTAYDAYQAAWAIRRSFDVACNLGRTEAELGLDVAAAEHLDYCLRTFSTSARDEFRNAEERFRQLLDGVLKRVSVLRLESRPLGAEVLVDGASMGNGPFETPLYLAPGEHRVVVRAKGYRQRELTLHFAAGATEAVQVKLELESSQSATREPAEPEPSRDAPRPRAETTRAPTRSTSEPARSAELRTAIVLGGTAITFAGLVVGAAFTLDAASTSRQTDSLRRGAAASGCTKGSKEAPCIDYRESIDREASSRNVAEIAFLTGGIAGAVSLAVWLLLPEGHVERTQAIRPFWTRDTAGVVLSGVYLE
jgi:hypothetical protein